MEKLCKLEHLQEIKLELTCIDDLSEYKKENDLYLAVEYMHQIEGISELNEILLTAEKYKCNLAVCKAEDSDDP